VSPSRHSPLALAAVAVALTALAIGCGSDGSGSGYGSRDSTAEQPTATATTPPAPPGATARDCGRTTVAGTEGLRVTGIGCDVGRGVVAAWTRTRSCSTPAGASRYACTVHEDFRCLGASADGGIAVSCSRPGGSLSFIAKRN
jgi:hypothetical protein